MHDWLDALDTPAVSRLTGVSSSTLEKWRLTGEGPPYLKLNRLVRYRSADVDAWLVARLVRSTSETRGK